MKKKLLLKADYLNKVRKLRAEKYIHWLNNPNRWQYHYIAIQFARGLRLNSTDRVLEIGALGVQICEDSETMDIPTTVWKGEKTNPTYIYDVNNPLPFEDKSYKLVVALQLLHLVKDRDAVLKELKRVAENVIVSVPNNNKLDEDEFTKVKVGDKVTVYLYKG